MNFAHFFIDRPIFAGVLSIVITLVGGIALTALPVAQLPDIAPPTVQISANYPGANARVVAETVATPIEQQVNGVENMLYMSSQSTSDGNMTLTATFKLGTNLDTAQVLVQNRVALAEPVLPEEVRRSGVSVKKQSPDITMVVHLISPDESLDQLFTSNYALLQVRDELARLDGVGDINVFGAREYSMRVWLDPNKVAARGMTARDVVDAIQEQNVQVAAGIVGAPPVPAGQTAFQYTVSTQGRLTDEREFGEIVIKTGADRQVTRVRDVARVELAARDYTVSSFLDSKPATALVIFQRPGSNAIATSDAVRAKMEELKTRFPAGLDYRIVYDPTVSVRESIHEVQKTLFEAILLVVVVVLVFLQSWRATIIPLVAIPVSLIGTFAAMAAFGFSLNNLSLLSLVLAIGIVVDDAIVVVENIEHHLANGLSPRDAARKAMDEVSGPVVAVALVLCAVFVPTAFMTGLPGQFFRQFALTIAISTAISAFNSLTLSPALGALLLRPHGAKRDWFARLLDGLLGWFFRLFNKSFAWGANAYGNLVRRLCRVAAVVLLVYGGLLALTALGFRVVPGGFIPAQDRGYCIVFCQLPDASSLDRSTAAMEKAAQIARATPGVKATVQFPGFNLLGGNQTNTATMFVSFDDFDKRHDPDRRGDAIIAKIRGRVTAEIPEAFVGVFAPPPVSGIGNAGGYKMQIQDRGGAGYDELQNLAFAMMMKANATPGLLGNITTFRANVPQLWLDVDRVKAKTMNVPLSSIFDTLQTYLGSTYVNDFNLFGRTYRVTAQADSPFRLSQDDIRMLKTRNADGGMVPLGSVATVRETSGPDKVVRYNMYPSAEISGASAPGFSSGQALATMEQLAKEVLPTSFTTEWTELSLQQKLAGNSAIFIFPLCVLFVFLVLAAQYESWSLPLAIILIVPMCLLSAIGGVWLRDFDNNILTQIGFVVLVGLACKNAILIVEFAKQIQDHDGKDRFAAAAEACQLRLRPILMTSFAFILGVLPLVISKGAGAEMRQALGTAVFYGMLGVTFFGLLLTPVFYVVIMAFKERPAQASPEPEDDTPPPTEEAGRSEANRMKLAIASDHAGFAYKERLISMLRGTGHEVRDFGAFSEQSVDYPLFIAPAAEAVASGECERGIVLGGSGNGEQITANKVRGIRCALCWSVETARLARQHNDANVISIGQRLVTADLAMEIVQAWLDAKFDGDRHTARVQQIAAVEVRAALGPASGFGVHEKTLLIRPEYLNHYLTVFGGYMMKWADDMAFNAASLTFPGTEFVTRTFDAFDFSNPVRSGDIIKVHARVESVGNTSCQVAVWCVNAETLQTVFRTMAVMVNVGPDGKKEADPTLNQQRVRALESCSTPGARSSHSLAMPATIAAPRVGARRMGSIPPRTLAALNRGTLETRTLAEGLVIDFAQLLRATVPRIPKPATDVMHAARAEGVSRRMTLAGHLLLAHLGPPGFFQLARHRSDTVRGWAAHLLAAAEEFSLGERLQLIRPLANDHNPGVREWAWLALRGHVAANITLAIDLLEAWTVAQSPFLRRFASEATRPRGVWCAKIDFLLARPSLGLVVLEPLRADPHRYVQDSVGNWLNDAAKSQPAWTREICARWRRESPGAATERICRRGLRSITNS